jgi:flagellin-like hook-associated protein FlgL
MLISADMTTTSLKLTEHYQLNAFQLSQNMLRVASGKRFQRPADSIPDYFRSQQFRADIRGQEQIQRELSIGSALLGTAKEIGQSVFEDLGKLQELMNHYYDPTTSADERQADRADFSAIKNRIIDTVENAYYDDWKLVQDNGNTPLLSIVLDPRDINMKYDIQYDAGDVTDASGLTLGSGAQAAEEAALQNELDHAASYLAKSIVYSDSVFSHRDMLAGKNVRYLESLDNTEAADDGAEMMALAKRNLSQQMTVSMIAQSNMFRSALAALIKTG